MARVSVGSSKVSAFKFYPVTKSRWKDFEILFGKRGACGGCWCMYWRLTRSQFEKQKGLRNKAQMKRMVFSGEVPGILGYVKNEPVAWCSVAPREDYSALDRSRVLKRIDENPVWSVVCFFVAKPYRKQGVSVKILKAAVDYARKRGAKIVEGYPYVTKKSLPDPFVYTGLLSTFKRAGFKEALRRSKSRPIMRYFMKEGRRHKFYLESAS